MEKGEVVDDATAYAVHGADACGVKPVGRACLADPKQGRTRAFGKLCSSPVGKRRGEDCLRPRRLVLRFIRHPTVPRHSVKRDAGSILFILSILSSISPFLSRPPPIHSIAYENPGGL